MGAEAFAEGGFDSGSTIDTAIISTFTRRGAGDPLTSVSNLAYDAKAR